MSFLQESGIYEIRNLTSNKVYIGQAKFIYQRWSKHRIDLKRGSHSNRHLQNAWNKYGEDDFIFRKIEVIENNLYNKDLANERELYWILNKKSNQDEFGYNIELPGRYRKATITKGENKKTNIFGYTDFLNHSKLNPTIFSYEERDFVATRCVELQEEGMVYLWVSKKSYLVIARVSNGKSRTVTLLSSKIKLECFGKSVIAIDFKTNHVIKEFSRIGLLADYFNLKVKSCQKCLDHNRFDKALTQKGPVYKETGGILILYADQYDSNKEYFPMCRREEMIKVWHKGVYKNYLTKKEINMIKGLETGDSVWERYRTLSYDQGRVKDFKYDLEYEFIKKPSLDSKELKQVEIKQVKKSNPVIIFKSLQGEVEMTKEEACLYFNKTRQQLSRFLTQNNYKGGRKKIQGGYLFYKIIS